MKRQGNFQAYTELHHMDPKKPMDLETINPLQLDMREHSTVDNLGIPKEELTPAVRIALSALLEKLGDTQRELQNARTHLNEMEQLVDVDCLAPIPNRRAFMRRLAWAIAMHQRYGHPSSILYFDLNNLKQINDSLGHAAGDMAIKQTAKVLMGLSRETDFVGRIGGDEFAIIMYYANLDAAKDRGRQIAEMLSKHGMNWNGRKETLSIAYGVYMLHPSDTAETALSAADMAMYLEKKRMKQELPQVQIEV